MTLDPATDDPKLLRTVIQLLRISALTASRREDCDGIHTADEKIAEALGSSARASSPSPTSRPLRPPRQGLRNLRNV